MSAEFRHRMQTVNRLDVALRLFEDFTQGAAPTLRALALAIEHPERVRRLVLVGSVSGFPAVQRWSIPHNWRWWRDREYWQALWWGFRLGSICVSRR